MPRLVLHRMTRSLRPGKVFVDWSQNAARKTTAAAYTLRAREQPWVSAPVRWEEVGEVVESGEAERVVLGVGEVVERVREWGDLLAPVFDAGRAGEVP